MSTKGRDNHPGAFLDWAWWNGLVGLIFTIICCFSLIFLLIYMDKSAKSNEIRPQMQRFSFYLNFQKKNEIFLFKKCFTK